MHSFTLDLDDGSRVSGLASLPDLPPSLDLTSLPLIVCLHGGTFDARYYDATPALSIENITSLFHVPVVSIHRPSYGETTPIPELPPNQTFMQESAKRLNSSILPAVWRKYGTYASSVVLLSHSIGAAVAIIVSGLHTIRAAKGEAEYPLSGLIVSGLGSSWISPNDELDEINTLITPEGLWPAELRAKMMLKPQLDVCALEAVKAAIEMNPPAPPAEIGDVAAGWLGYWRTYAREITVPVLYSLPEFDCFWPRKSLDADRGKVVDRVREFADAFEKSEAVATGTLLGAPHCVEISKQGRSWYLRCVGFAMECAMRRTMK